MRWCIILLLSIFFTASVSAQALLLPNEEVIFTFRTAGKQVMLAKDKADGYIVYRFGTNAKVDFEFPEKTAESWKKFKYNYYLRGGGVRNEGMDMNYVSFQNNGYRYTIFDTYAAIGNEHGIGVKVTNITTKKTTVIPGIYRSRKGSIVDFRFNNRLEEGEELFD